MKLLISSLSVYICMIFFMYNNTNTNIIENNNILNLVLNYIFLLLLITCIVTTFYKIIVEIKKDIINSINAKTELSKQQLIKLISKDTDYIVANNITIGNNIIHAIITDSQLHHDKLIILLNNNLIKSHSIHEVLKELFMLEQNTNRLLHFDVDTNPQDLFCKQVIKDNKINSDKTLEESFIDDKITINDKVIKCKTSSKKK